MPNISPKNLSSKNSPKNVSLEMIFEEQKTPKNAKKVANFQKSYLSAGLWPEIPAKAQAQFKSDFKSLQCKYNNKKNSLKQLQETSQILPCKSCKKLKKKNVSTQLALKEAVDLSMMLLKEIKKSNSVIK